jgi:hypothetical protein
MLIELHRKVVAGEVTDSCVICGNDHDIERVYVVTHGDRGEEMGPMCDLCLDYLNRRKHDPRDPTLNNWPARGWPTVEVLERLRQRYPVAMFDTEEELLAAATDRAADERIYGAAAVWRMEREGRPLVGAVATDRAGVYARPRSLPLREENMTDENTRKARERDALELIAAELERLRILREYELGVQIIDKEGDLFVRSLED